MMAAALSIAAILLLPRLDHSQPLLDADKFRHNITPLKNYQITGQTMSAARMIVILAAIVCAAASLSAPLDGAAC